VAAGKQSADSYQQSAISGQQSAVSNQPTDFSPQSPKGFRKERRRKAKPSCAPFPRRTGCRGEGGKERLAFVLFGCVCDTERDHQIPAYEFGAPQ
jgi:hypothetical protein